MPIDFTDSAVLTELKTAGYMSTEEANTLSSTHNSALEANKNSILKQLQEQKEKFNGVDVEAYNKLNEDSRFKSVLTGGFDNYEASLGGELQGRLSASQSDLMIKEQGYLQKEKDFESTIDALTKNLSHSELKRKLGMALVKNDLVDPLAVSDIERDALEQLALDDKGGIVVMGEDGLIRQTADGPMREDDWLKDMMKSKPYRFRGSDGGGRHITSGNINTDKMSPREKIKLGRQRA